MLLTIAKINRHFARTHNGELLECGICACVPTDPVRACGGRVASQPLCNHLVCRSCADRAQAAGKCFFCGKRLTTSTAMPFVVTDEDQEAVAICLSKESVLRRAASTVVEHYVFEICFRDREASLPNDLLQDLVCMMATRPAHVNSAQDYLNADEDSLVAAADAADSIASRMEMRAGVIDSPGSHVALLRTLLSLTDPSNQAVVDQTLTSVLNQSVKLYSYFDTPVAVGYAVRQEENCRLRAPTIQQALLDDYLTRINISLLQGDADALRLSTARARLDSIAAARHVLVLFARQVEATFPRDSGDLDAEQAAQALAQLTEQSNRLTPLLSATHPDAPTIRPTVMFLLKQLERMRGHSFVRECLLRPPFVTSVWFDRWLQSGDVVLQRFRGEGKLPRLNPFQTLPLWESVNSAVGTAVASGGNCSMLAATAAEHHEKPSFKTALLAALFHQVYLLKLMDRVSDLTAARAIEIQEWVRTAPELAWVPRSERQVLYFFAGGQIADPTLAAALGFLTLSPASSSEQVQLVRLMAHMAAMGMSAGATSRGVNMLSYFGSLMYNLSETAGHALPCMPQDDLAMLISVLGGRWYTCANGHPFFVDACGRPTEIIKCNVCNVQIGGLNHNADFGIKDVFGDLGGGYFQRTNVVDNSPMGYCLKVPPAPSAEQNLLEPARGMSPLHDRVLRFLMHGSLLLGALGGGQTYVTEFMTNVVNRQHAQIPTHLPEFLVSHVQFDWRAISRLMRRNSDDVVTLMHLMLDKFAATSKAVVWNFICYLICCCLHLIFMFCLVLLFFHQRDWRLLPQQKLRSEFETEVCKEIITPILSADGVEKRLAEAAERYKTAASDEGAVFVAELREQISWDTFTPQRRAQLLPALWRYRQPLTMDEFNNMLNATVESQQRHPVLSKFMREEPKLRALRNIPSMFDLSNLLLNRM